MPMFCKSQLLFENNLQNFKWKKTPENQLKSLVTKSNYNVFIKVYHENITDLTCSSNPDKFSQFPVHIWGSILLWHVRRENNVK